jgi:hypothetical protein
MFISEDAASMHGHKRTPHDGHPLSTSMPQLALRESGRNRGREALAAPGIWERAAGSRGIRSRDARHSRVGRPDYTRTNNWQRRPSTVYDRAGWHPARRIPFTLRITLQQCSIKAANGQSSICELHTSHIKWGSYWKGKKKTEQRDLPPTVSVRYFDLAIHSRKSPASHTHTVRSRSQVLRPIDCWNI